MATSQDELNKILPNYIQNTAVQADVPGVVGANGAVSDPVFLAYPASPVRTVTGIPGKGGTYTTMTPLWGAIPPSSGNAYYDAVNKALGATLKIQPADGNTYGDKLPPLFAADKVPDWIQIPGWNTAPLNFGQAVGAKFADLTPYLAGNKVRPTRTWPTSRPRPGRRRSGTASSTACRSTRAAPASPAPTSTARTSSTSSASTPTASRRPTTWPRWASS